MDYTSQIGDVVIDANIGTVLKQGAKGDDVKALQVLLYTLGFGEELNWEKFKEDGDYGNSVVTAVKAFAEKNGISADGTVITEEIAKKLSQRHESLDELQLLQKDVKADKVESTYKAKGKKTSIAAMQTLLNELGYGAELNWDKYKDDGFFGNSSKAALTKFASDEGKSFNNTNLSKELAELIISKLVGFYGKDWDKPTPIQESAGGGRLVQYENDSFFGKQMTVNKSFVPTLDRIAGYAKANGIKVYITSTFRADANVKGAVVTPARRSNHMVGHAFDFNLQFDGGWANNAMLKKYPDVPAPVKGFIDAIRNDGKLRWGGDFKPIDAIHIDDAFNQDRGAFDKEYVAIRQ